MVLVLGVSMGLCVAVCHWVDALYLDPLRVPRASELVTFQRTSEDRGVIQRRTSMTWSQAQRSALIAGNESSAIASAVDDPVARRLTIEWSPTMAEDAPVQFVSSNYGRVLGVNVATGRDLVADDDREGTVPVALVSYEAWQHRWGGRADVVGQTLRVNGTPVTVVGVAPREGWITRVMAQGPALFLPLGSASVIGRSARGTERSYPDQREPTAAPDARVLTRFQVISRVTGARDGLDALTRSTLRSDQWAAVPLVETLLPFDTRHELLRFLQLLALAGGSTLLIACVNVAAPMTSSAHRRRQQVAIQIALGATPARIGQLFACDALVIAAASGVVGYFVALIANAAIVQLAVADVALAQPLPFDAVRLGVYSFVLAVTVAFIVGLFPIRWAISQASGPLGRSPAVRGRPTFGASRLVVGGQAAACVALSASGLYFVSVLATGLQKDLGFDPSGLYHARIFLTPAQRQTVNAVDAANLILSDVSMLPAFADASLGPSPFFDTPDRSTSTFHIDGSPVVTVDPIDLVYVGPGYFETLRQRIVRGRAFSAQDVVVDRQGFVAIVNEPAASLFWGGGEAVGHRLVLDHFVRQVAPAKGTVTCAYQNSGGTPDCSVPTRPVDSLVIGVVPGALVRHLGESPRPVIYLPLSQWEGVGASAGALTGTVSMVVRSREALDKTRRVLDEVARARGFSVDSVSSALDARNAMLRPARVVGLVLMMMAGASLGVILIAILAASAEHVASQERVTAIRLALGAASGALVRRTVAPLAFALSSGVCAGLAALVLVRPHVEPLGLGTPFLRPFIVAVPAGFVVFCGVASAYATARRVYKIEPARLLRQ